MEESLHLLQGKLTLKGHGNPSTCSHHDIFTAWYFSTAEFVYVFRKPLQSLRLYKTYLCLPDLVSNTDPALTQSLTSRFAYYVHSMFELIVLSCNAKHVICSQGSSQSAHFIIPNLTGLIIFSSLHQLVCGYNSFAE